MLVLEKKNEMFKDERFLVKKIDFWRRRKVFAGSGEYEEKFLEKMERFLEKRKCFF